jgi:hypothetical protein
MHFRSAAYLLRRAAARPLPVIHFASFEEKISDGLCFPGIPDPGDGLKQ